MAVWTLQTFFAIAVYAKCTAYEGIGRDTDMSVPTTSIGAVSLREMQTCRSTFWCKVVGEIAGVSCLADTLLEEIPADCHSAGVVNEPTLRAFEACTYMLLVT
jgi:hypothetical protein